MAVCAIFFLIIATNQARLLYKGILITGSTFMIMAMGYSGTRTAYAIVVVALAFFILLNFNKKSTRVFGLFASVIILFLLFAPIYGNKTIQRFRTTFVGEKDESYKVRVLSRTFIQPYIRSHPIGGGLGTTGFSGAEKHSGHFLANFQPDSGYVQRAAETGWSGLAEICVLYFIALWTGIKGFFSVKNEKIKIIYAACVTSLYAFYIAEFAQVAVGGVSDAVVYYPILAIILKLKYYDSDNLAG
jgi:O-antigen ligase